MKYLCQNQPYLKEIITKVISCAPFNIENSQTHNNNHIVELEETIFFAEGGGQPADYGKIGDSNVLWVTKESGKIIHRVDKPLDVGDTVQCTLNWSRRYDHMQQHSGQHLLSAILDCHNIPTLSWELGSHCCNVDIKASSNMMTDEFLEQVEQEVNSKIRQSLPVIFHEYNADQTEQLIKQGRINKNVPKTDLGLISIIEIKDTDFNMCCGTHVSSLAELQAIKLLHVEPSRGYIRLNFLCGQRVLDKLSKCYYNERQLNKALSCQPGEHVMRANNICNEMRSLAKTKSNLLKEIAITDAMKIISCESKFQFIHKEAYDDIAYLTTLMKTLNDNMNDDSKEKVIMVVCGAIKNGSGLFSLKASDEFFNNYESMILTQLEAKGKSRNGNLQGKAGSFKKLNSLVKDLEKLLII